MRRAFLVLAIGFLVLPAYAGDFELGIRHLAHLPQSDGAYASGRIDVVGSRGFAMTGEWFFTPRVSTQLAATFVNPAAILHPATGAPPDLDLNTLGMNTWSLTARRHFSPILGFAPFAGAGAAVTTFGNLEERFGDRIEMDFDPSVSWLVEGGIRYNFHGGLWLDAAVSYMPLEAEPSSVRNETNIELPASISVDPMILSVGAAWRF